VLGSNSSPLRPQLNSTTKPVVNNPAPIKPPTNSNFQPAVKPAITPTKQAIPVIKKTIPPVVPEEKLAQLEIEDSANRAKPKQKPKIDHNRKSQFLLAPLGVQIPPQPTQPAPPPPKVEEKVEPKVVPKVEPKVEPKVVEKQLPDKSIQSYSSISANVDSFLNEVNDKWKIEYDELEFDELVSTGSAGEVFLGYYFGTPVAIKKLYALPPDQKHLVSREFAMLQGVNHPNIVQFLGICDHESGVYLITEYVEHGDLFDLLVFGSDPPSWKNKVKIALQVAQAVYYLHSKKIIHRDLKSQNVLIGENYKVNLCDLGLATVQEAAKRLTVCGTHEWMAPEILLQDHYDDKVDVFSFGVVLTELITCKPPKKREMSQMLQFSVPSFMNSIPEGCPPDFTQLVIDCTKFKPEERPTIKEIVTRLRKLQNELTDD